MTRLAAIAALVACGGDGKTCGPGDAPADGVVAMVGSATATYGNFTFGLNGDCGSESVSTFATQTDATGVLRFDLCVEHPDQLAQGLALGPDEQNAGVPVHVVDFEGLRGRLHVRHRSQPRRPARRRQGRYCGGAHGFALSVTGSIPVTRTCGSTVDQITMTIAGSAAVAPME